MLDTLVLTKLGPEILIKDGRVVADESFRLIVVVLGSWSDKEELG